MDVGTRWLTQIYVMEVANPFQSQNNLLLQIIVYQIPQPISVIYVYQAAFKQSKYLWIAKDGREVLYSKQ